MIHEKTKIFQICLLVKFASHGISLRWNLSYFKLKLFDLSELIVRNITGLRHMHWLGIQSLEGGLYLKKVGGGALIMIKMIIYMAWMFRMMRMRMKRRRHLYQLFWLLSTKEQLELLGIYTIQSSGLNIQYSFLV